MIDAKRYRTAGRSLLCDDCREEGGAARVVHTFTASDPSLLDLQVHAGIHEERAHGAVAASSDDAAATLRSVAASLEAHAARVERDLAGNPYWAGYPRETAYRDGVTGGMGLPSGSLAGMFGPEAARHTAALLREVATLGADCPELLQDHDRTTCGDRACAAFGYAVELARTIERVGLPEEDRALVELIRLGQALGDDPVPKGTQACKSGRGEPPGQGRVGPPAPP